jgi:outer membrane protein assembly factor BamE (lipoprotein component of BamABCDE complex)
MLRSRWNPACLLLVLAAALPSCVLSSISFGDKLRTATSAEAIVPGLTSRAEVLQLLGPPEEFSQPTPLLGLRAWDPQEQRVLKERDVFHRRTWTWIREQREDQLLWIPLPFVWANTEHDADRIMVTFDKRGLVTAVGFEFMDGTR